MPVNGPAFAPRVLRLLIACVGMLVASGASASVCTVSSGTAAIGLTSSFVAASTPEMTVADSGFKCAGSILSLLSTNTVTATFTGSTRQSGSIPLLVNDVSGDSIPYSICQDSSCASPAQVGGQISWSKTSFLDLLGLFSGTNGTLPVYVRTAPGGTPLAAGTYHSTINITWDWNLCPIGVNVGGAKVCVADTGHQPGTISVTMVVASDCVITAPPVSFGSAAFTENFNPVTQSLTVLCSKGAAYSVGIDNGLHFSGYRRLAGPGGFLNYEIYYPASSATRWGAVATERQSSDLATVNARSYTGSVGQTFTYRAQILAGQGTPSIGDYKDTLTVDVAF